ncbi:MAG: SDR family oxidoreductase [Beijerinckiaceae bacterium]
MATEMLSLRNRVAVITGGTQGLGEHVARLFAARGASGIVLVGRNGARGKAVAESLTGSGCHALFVQADLAQLDQVRRIIPAAEKEFGRVDCLVNAGASTDRGTITDTAPEMYDYIMDVNVKAPFFLMQDAITLMQKQKIAGSIVNILSMSAHGGQPFLTPYSMSKGALLTLTKNVAFAMLGQKIRVNGLNVGWMDTPGEEAIGIQYHDRKPGWIAEAQKSQPWGRLVSPDEIARACAYLCADESGLMSGAIIDFAQAVVGTHN